MCNKCSTNDPKARLKYQIAVMQAAADGKEIQRGPGRSSTGPWVDADNPAWDWSMLDYRVKPREPREFFIKYYPTRHRGTAYDSYVEASEFAVPNSEKIIKVREVIEDEPTSSCCTCWGKYL